LYSIDEVQGQFVILWRVLDENVGNMLWTGQGRAIQQRIA